MSREIKIPMGIPLIGQGPTPEQVAQAHQETMAVFKTWPVHAYPTGQQAGPFWGGETMLHRFATHAMDMLKDQFAAKSRTDEELVQLGRKCWKIAIIMMQTAPFGVVQDPNQEKKDEAATSSDDDGAEPHGGDGAFPPGAHVEAGAQGVRGPLRAVERAPDRAGT